MSEISARNSLKSWAKEVMNKLNSMSKNDYLKHKSFVIRIFATILIYKASNYKLKVCSKNELENDVVWKKVQSIYSINSLASLEVEDINNEFFDNTVEFLVGFCEENYTYLDNMLAWVYQYLNINSYDNENKDTQFFTDQYMVEFLVQGAFDQFKDKDIISIDSIDPACGGGNFIVTIIEKLYFRLGLNNKDFLKYIEQHIFGYDIDINLAIICVINIYIKLLELKILDINEIFNSNFNIYYDYNNKFGSLLKCNSLNEDILLRATDNKIVKFNEIFTNRYSVLITNPPFKGRREQDDEIRKYITSNYKCAKGDICNSFVERLYDLVTEDGIAAFVMQNGWMYLESFKELRSKLLSNGSIKSLIDLGSNSFFDLSGEKANISLLIYSRNKGHDKFSVYSFKQYKYEEKIDKLMNLNYATEDEYELDIESILNDIEFRIDYLNRGNIRDALYSLEQYSKYAKPMQGTSTGDSKKFVKYHWEVEGNEEWCLVSKGGGYCKWSGLNIYKIKWGEDGEEIKSHPKSVVRNTQYFNNTDLVYSDTGTSGLSVRLLRSDQIFIASGPGIFIKDGDKYCHLAFLNSRLASYYIKVLTPKLTISATYIGKLPIIREILFDKKLSDISSKIVKLKEKYNKKRPINYEYEADKFLKYNSIYEYAKNDFIGDLEIELHRLKLEKIINDRIISYYKFTSEEIEYVYSKVGVNPYSIDNNQECLNIKEIDDTISKILDCNCYVKSTRVSKQTLGVEGILESMAVNRGINPEKLFQLVKNNIDQFKNTIIVYYKHTLHRIKLLQLGYLHENYEEINNSIINRIILEDKKNFNINIDEKKWFSRQIYEWHKKSFLNKPILNNGEYNE